MDNSVKKTKYGFKLKAGSLEWTVTARSLEEALNILRQAGLDPDDYSRVIELDPEGEICGIGYIPEDSQ